VKLTKGTKISAGQTSFMVGDVSPNDFGEAKLRVTLENKTGFDAIRSIVFLDAQGNEIKTEQMGSSRAGFNDEFTYGQSYGLPDKVDSVTLKISYFEKVESIEIPLDLKVSVGL
jgi:hypothetical protein